MALVNYNLISYLITIYRDPSELFCFLYMIAIRIYACFLWEGFILIKYSNSTMALSKSFIAKQETP